MTVVLKVLAVLLLTLPPSAYVAGRIAGPPELSVYGQSVTTAPTPPQAPKPPWVDPARPDRSPSPSLAGVSAERTPGQRRAEAGAAVAEKGDQRRRAARGEGTRADGRAKPDTDSPRQSPRRPWTPGPNQRDRPDEPLVARAPEPEPSPAEGSVEVHGDSVEAPDAVEVVRGDEYETGADDGYDDSPGDGSVVIEGGEPW